jgi:LSD1 subclass zinc finger protein
MDEEEYVIVRYIRAGAKAYKCSHCHALGGV